MSEITVYHNPRCSNSRGVLEILRAAGLEHEVIEYLDTPPSKATLTALLAVMGLSARELLRAKETVYVELDLGKAAWTAEELINFMVAYPVLINRPIVVTPKGVRLCRPPEVVHEIL
ncbi:MAG: arsenate reductase (glutaredoxin) [Rhodocyclaceae bacterium]|nr:arsenate reductase (glutaredoxin) [Rhodocyclaceae bacterium]